MIKILFIIGTRPEAIKMAPIIIKCKEFPKEIVPLVISTSQHDKLLDQALKMFNIIPDYNLKIMKKNQTLFDVTSRVLLRMEKLLEQLKPNIILVQGDTSTVLAASLAGFYKKIDIGHVEAGLRSYDRYNPFPEELNRKLTSGIATLHFAPTKSSKENLLKESINKNTIFVTGNSVIDSLFLTLNKKWNQKIDNINWNKKIVLITAHRRENFGKGLENIVDAINILSNRKDIQIILPVHPNPNVKNVVLNSLNKKENIKLFDPFDYITFVNIMKRASIILTDSGGVQEEAPSLGVPVLVMRKVTERPEAVKAGCVKVIGTSKKNIINETINLLENKEIYEKMSKAINPYGDGKASERIINIILKKYNRTKK